MIGIDDKDITISKDPNELLRELRDAIREPPDFLKSRRISDEVQDAYLAEKPDARQQALLTDIERRRRALRRMQLMVEHLARVWFEQAIPALAEIWVEGALPSLSNTAAHALYEMKSDAAWDALESRIEQYDHFSRFMGIKAAFDRAPDRAFDRFEQVFSSLEPNSQKMAEEVLWFLCPDGQMPQDGAWIPTWPEPRVRAWLEADPRWLDLCARLRRHPRYGRSAREALRHVDPKKRDAALKRARAAEPSRDPEIRTERSGDLLRRYRDGERVAVWEEIRSFERIEGAFREEVMDVARETMERVAGNADMLSERLEDHGWRAIGGRLRIMPSAEDSGVIRRIEEISGGPVPPTLLAFWTVVGGIDWIWDYRSERPAPDLGFDLPLLALDPLCVDPAGVVDWQFEEWERQKVQPDPDLIDPYDLSLAPDSFHKANFSGGQAYGIELPFFGADPVFAHEPHQLPFVDYLRLGFRWAGFPGLENHGDQRDVRDFVAAFGEGLEPF